VPVGPGSLGEQRREPLHPAVAADVVDLNAPLNQEFFDVAVGEAEPQVPATASTITSGGKRKPAKAERAGMDRRERLAVLMGSSLNALTASQRTQQSPRGRFALAVAG
jgi:hypothetical protein